MGVARIVNLQEAIVTYFARNLGFKVYVLRR